MAVFENSVLLSTIVMGSVNVTSKDRLKNIRTFLSELDAHSECHEVELLLLIEALLNFYKNIRQKLNDTVTAYESIRGDLELTKTALQKKETELESISTAACSKCVDLEKELHISKKKLHQNESRIKSIVNILSVRASQDGDTEHSHQTSVTKAFDLVSQMLLGSEQPSTNRPQKSHDCPTKKRRRSDSLEAVCDDVGILASETLQLEVKDPRPSHCIPDSVCQDSLEVPCTPKKQVTAVMKKEKNSPVLGSGSKRNNCKTSGIRHQPEANLNCFLNLDETCISPSLLRTSGVGEMDGNASQAQKGRKKKRADFWQLKTTHNVETDILQSRAAGQKKLKQAQLSLGCYIKKQDLPSLKEFNNGIRPSQASSQVPQSKITTKALVEQEMLALAIKESLKEKENRELTVPSGDEDVVMESPNSLQTSRIHRKIKRELSSDVDDTAFLEPVQPDFGAEYDWAPKEGMSSPNYKYRRETVRKKSARKQLDGWDCDQCRKYFEAVGRKQKEHMDQCSRHRDRYAVQPITPPGFWDADFPDTQELRARNMNLTHVTTDL